MILAAFSLTPSAMDGDPMIDDEVGARAYESHGARVLEVRIRLPPPEGLRTFGS
jgi:hypothetical protein